MYLPSSRNPYLHQSREDTGSEGDKVSPGQMMGPLLFQKKKYMKISKFVISDMICAKRKSYFSYTHQLTSLEWSNFFPVSVRNSKKYDEGCVT